MVAVRCHPSTASCAPSLLRYNSAIIHFGSITCGAWEFDCRFHKKNPEKKTTQEHPCKNKIKRK
jgi:hypothetical protein